ncbi:autotransporter outer membrane beta-barrel domain-containing protein [Telmatospirillum siberiense]|nr:autotransporter outer membrane beta-barrel domain-containing protein [Telmatospirillum siberiense]
MPFKLFLLAGASGIVLGLPMSAHAVSSCDTTGTISGSGASWSWTSGNCQIGATAQPSVISASGTSLGTLTNLATISISGLILANSGTMAALINGDTPGSGAALSSSGTSAIINTGTIGALTNHGTINGAASGAIMNYGLIGTLSNDGTISGIHAIHNHGPITLLINQANGVIQATSSAIRNDVGTIGTLVNEGIISGSPAVENAVSIGSINNSGTITSTGTAILNTGTIGTIDNSGTISGAVYAISNSSAGFGILTNSGVIAGDILNSSTTALTINGGSAAYGTLTGYAAGMAGTITSTQSNLVFNSGYLLLNDDINVGASHLVINNGATLKLASARTITGSYKQSGGGLVIVTSNAGTSYGYLTVSGSASVTSTSVTISGAGLTSGETFTIVRSGTGGTYANDTATISGSSGLTASVSTSGGDLLVTLVTCASCAGTSSAGTSYQALGRPAGHNAATMGAALDALSSSATLSADMTGILSTISGLSTTQAAQAIRQLGPSQTTAPALMGFSADGLASGALTQHQQAAMVYDPATGKAAGSEGHGNSLWGQVLGGGAIRSGTDSTAGFRVKEFGLASGVDHMFADDLMGGAALSWVRAYAAGSDSAATNSTLDSYMLTGYGSWRQGPWFVDGQAGAGYNRFHQKRGVDFLGRTANVDFDGEHYLLRGQTGYDWPVGGAVTLAPLAGLTYLYSVNNGYTESGAAGADLTIDRKGAGSLSHDLGGRVRWSAETPWGRVKPELRAEWVHDYRQSGLATTGTLAGAAFTTSTPRTSPDGAQIGVAATLEGTDALSFRAEYSGDLRADYQSHTGVIKVLWGF